MPARQQWTAEEAQAWYADQPWLAGCNYVPSNAVNQLEMWQAETFDLETNARELGWASDLGFNTVRVFLHDLLWAQDQRGFIDRVDRFLDTSAGLGIRPMFVLFDGVWDPFPKLGPQPAARPRVHNSRWVQSPGAEALADSTRHEALAGYVGGVVGHFRDDERIVAWDLFNEPDNPNPAYAASELSNKAELAEELLRKSFSWAREAGPSQPITAGVWRGRWGDIDTVSAIDRLMLTESDVISFHSYAPAERVLESIEELRVYGRPLLITEYLARPTGSTFETVLPVLREQSAGAYSWGLVSGKTQTIYPWDSWTKQYAEEPPLWFHDILRPDGRPYREAEAETIRWLTGNG